MPMTYTEASDLALEMHMPVPDSRMHAIDRWLDRMAYVKSQREHLERAKRGGFVEAASQTLERLVGAMAEANRYAAAPDEAGTITTAEVA